MDDDVSAIDTEKTSNFISNKSSHIDLAFQVSRANSASRKDFRFNQINRCSSNSHLRQSQNQAPTCCGQYQNLNMSHQNSMIASMNRPLCQSVCGYSCVPQTTVACNSVLGHHNLLAASYSDLQSAKVNDQVVNRLENAEQILKKMDKKVDKLRFEKKSSNKQMKKLVKRIGSASIGRDNDPISTRNFQQSNKKKFVKHSQGPNDSQVSHLINFPNRINSYPRRRPITQDMRMILNSLKMSQKLSWD